MNSFHILLIFTLITMAVGHSQLTDPQATAPMSCRVGGEPQFGIEDCPGPCDMRAIEGNYVIHGSTDNPARVYQRGQTATIKYTRNNHPPGGFMRLTLVRPDKMMDKSEHNKNAFYYSCWGANAVAASPDEMKEMEFGYTNVGSDGRQHRLAKGYYTTTIVIPKVIPDGDYVLGWVWFGGTGSGEVENNGPATKEPMPYGYFSDYWSCSFVKIEGGAALEASHVPVFNNDMAQFSEEGCMSANNSPDVCRYEPCEVTGKYQKPYPFTNGMTPRALTPADFGGETPADSPSASAPSTTSTVTEKSSTSVSDDSEETNVRRRACRCILQDTGCWERLAERTNNYCKHNIPYYEQPTVCKEACCVFCKEKPFATICEKESVRATCKI